VTEEENKEENRYKKEIGTPIFFNAPL